jgi:glycosyltransferase involved in cell wall biosynthesis
VITTDVGDLASLSGDYLIMLQHESAEELAGVFEQIAENPKKYEQIALAARDFSRRESSYEAVGKKLTAFLAEVFTNNRFRPGGQEGISF